MCINYNELINEIANKIQPKYYLDLVKNDVDNFKLNLEFKNCNCNTILNINFYKSFTLYCVPHNHQKQDKDVLDLFVDYEKSKMRTNRYVY